VSRLWRSDLQKGGAQYLRQEAWDEPMGLSQKRCGDSAISFSPQVLSKAVEGTWNCNPPRVPGAGMFGVDLNERVRGASHHSLHLGRVHCTSCGDTIGILANAPTPDLQRVERAI
jgi:hypothetical protein